MTRLDLLMLKYKAGSITDPDLKLCLSYIHSLQLSKYNERQPENIERVDPVPGEDNNPKPRRLKAQRL